MAILLDGFSVIIRRSTIERKYPGGLRAYERDGPNATYCADEQLCRVSFMTFAGAETFVWGLAAAGLTPYQDDAAEDVVIAAPEKGFWRACSWLECDRRGASVIVWLKGTAAGVITKSESNPLPQKVADQSQFAGTQEEERRRKVNEIYKKACGLMDGLISLDGEILSREQRRRLEQAVPLFETVIEMQPAHWAAMWTMGKVLESLGGDVQRRFELFARAYRVNPDQADVAREAGLAAILVGRHEDALLFCRRALALDPNDSGLRTNLALSLLLMGEVDAAKTNILGALREDSGNEIIQHLAKVVDEVAVGLRPCPRHIQEMQ
jgi:hypothetical protein